MTHRKDPHWALIILVAVAIAVTCLSTSRVRAAEIKGQRPISAKCSVAEQTKHWPDSLASGFDDIMARFSEVFGGVGARFNQSFVESIHFAADELSCVFEHLGDAARYAVSLRYFL